MYAPLINSYKRYIEGTWAPLNTTWGMDNRTCSVRVINNGRKAIRLENRVPGSDANFYLVFAAMLASGLYGIEHKLELPSRLDGNAYNAAAIAQAVEAGNVKSLARDLTAATEIFERSAFGVFGIAERAHIRKIDDECLVEPDLHFAFIVQARRAGDRDRRRRAARYHRPRGEPVPARRRRAKAIAS